MFLDKLIHKSVEEEKNISEKQTLPNRESQVLKVLTLDQYRRALKGGSKVEFDFSELNMENQDIQDIDLENRGLTINLRKIFIPWGGRKKVSPIDYISGYRKNAFLYLNHSNLKGNKIEGDLSFFQSGDQRVYFCYNEDTFDEKYKEKYSQFFLSKESPQELKEKYYKPLKIQIDTDSISYCRQSLTFNEYIKYYEWLKGKYIGNFNINSEDYGKIRLVHTLGIEQTEKIVEDLAASCLPLKESFTIIGKMSEQEFLSLMDNRKNNLEKNEISYQLQMVQVLK